MALTATFNAPSPWQRLKPVLTGFDGLLLVAMVLLAAAGLFVVAQIPPQTLMKLAIPLYIVGVLLLIMTALPGIGITKKGATRWLNVGVVIQPSEILKIAM